MTNLVYTLGLSMIFIGCLVFIISSIAFCSIKPPGKLLIDSELELNIPHADNIGKLDRLAVINKPIEIKISSVPDKDAVPVINRIVNEIRHNKGYIRHISYKAFHDSFVPTISGIIPVSYLYEFRDFVESNNIIYLNEIDTKISGYYLSDSDFNTQNQYIYVEIWINSPIFERIITPFILLISSFICIVGFLICFCTKPNTREVIVN